MTEFTVSRRALAAAAFGTFMFATAGTAVAGNLVVSNWEGYMAPDVVDTFKAATGVQAEVVVHATNEEIMGKLIASGGKGYDIVFVSSPFAEVLHNLGLAETIDHAKVPNLANLYPEAAALPHDPGNTFSVPYTWGTTSLCYRSDLVKDAPSSWKALLEALGRGEGQDDHARHRPLAAGGRTAHHRLFGQRDRCDQDGPGQGPADFGEAHAARL